MNNTVEVQKRMKSIAREVHLSSVAQSEFYEATRILFVYKENKNNQQIISSLSLLSSNRHFGYYPPKGPPSQRDSHKFPGFYLKYLKLSSEDELRFYGFGTTCGLVNNDKILFLGWSNPLSVLEGNTDSYTLKYTFKN